MTLLGCTFAKQRLGFDRRQLASRILVFNRYPTLAILLAGLGIFSLSLFLKIEKFFFFF